MAQSNLHDAKINKNDEFYTQYKDIENEMNSYVEYNKDVFRDKTILLPCDDPEWSNFTKYFVANFERFGLKKIISTSYAKSSGNLKTTDFEKKSDKYDAEKHATHGKLFILDRDANNSGHIGFDDIQFDYLDGDGDFRSDEIKLLRDAADIIVTNPPFSLFTEFIDWIREANKSFIVIGRLTAIQDKNIFPLFMNNEIWLGSSYFNSGAAYFIAPIELYDPSKMSNPKNAYSKDGKFYWRVNGVRWYTNLEHGCRHEKMELMTMSDNIQYNKKLKKKFDTEFNGRNYPKYDNYDAIEVPYCDGIPSDYYGIMGVPISFMDKYCPEQFEILGSTQRGCHDLVPDTKKYDNYREVRPDGTFTGSTGNKTNENANIEKNDGTNNYFINDDGHIVQSKFGRIFIRQRRD